MATASDQSDPAPAAGAGGPPSARISTAPRCRRRSPPHHPALAVRRRRGSQRAAVLPASQGDRQPALAVRRRRGSQRAVPDPVPLLPPLRRWRSAVGEDLNSDLNSTEVLRDPALAVRRRRGSQRMDARAFRQDHGRPALAATRRRGGARRGGPGTGRPGRVSRLLSVRWSPGRPCGARGHPRFRSSDPAAPSSGRGAPCVRWSATAGGRPCRLWPAGSCTGGGWRVCPASTSAEGPGAGRCSSGRCRGSCPAWSPARPVPASRATSPAPRRGCRRRSGRRGVCPAGLGLGRHGRVLGQDAARFICRRRPSAVGAGR